MDTPPAPQPGPAQPRSVADIKLFGIGRAGLVVMERLIGLGFPAAATVAVDTGPLETTSAAEQFQVELPRPRGQAPVDDPGRGSVLAEVCGARLKSLCEGVKVVFIVAGMGGGAGTNISPILARAAREAGALVLAFATTPFECEASRRQIVALEGIEELTEVVDGVICLPNQKLTKLIDDRTSVLEAYKIAAEYLADAVLGIWRLLSHKGLIEIHFADLCELLRGRPADCALAVAQAAGATRSRDVVDKLLAHPMLDGGEMLSDSDAVLVSLMGGPDLTMIEVNRVMEEISRKCERAQVIMGAAIDPAFAENLAVTLIAGRQPSGMVARGTTARGGLEGLDTQLVDRCAPARPGSRFVPPPPAIPQEKLRKMFDEQSTGAARQRKPRTKMRQGQLPLEIVSKGRFDKSEPTIHKGEDLDVPTYIRRGFPLN
jgi:cell division protein FtsZ